MIHINYENKIYNIDISEIVYYRLKEKIKYAIMHDKHETFGNYNFLVDKKLKFSMQQIDDKTYNIKFSHRISVTYRILHFLMLDWLLY